MDAANKEPPIQQLFTDLEAAHERLKDAQAQYQAANSRECAARNDVNKAQAAIDARLKAMRDAAPRDSDWARVSVKRNEIAA
jgi:hypothetical protein